MSLRELVDSTDWAATPVGVRSSWPQSLETAVGICLASRFPILLWWGPDLVKIYNDAYAPILGAKHPEALGRAGRDVWPEIWHIIGPMLDGVMCRGEATWSDDQLLMLHRNGYDEECYFTFSYSPIFDGGSVAGVFTAVTETSERVVGARRLVTLRALAEKAVSAKSLDEACTEAAVILGANTRDLPWTAIYRADGDMMRRKATSGITPRWLPEQLKLDADLTTHDGPPVVQLPLVLAGEEAPSGMFVAGVSPFKALDGAYREFLADAARQVSAALSNANAYEIERRRADALAELDAAKTRFFSSISHEFRTPLTLMIGPTEELMRRSDGAAPEELKDVHSNALRLMRLVNALLDFSRIEAGKQLPRLEGVDLRALTLELVEAFRTTAEKADLRLNATMPETPLPTNVDPAMWEKIVLNLLSNAVKFTAAGSIDVGLRLTGDHIELKVRDTGIGIAEDQRELVFERFHRADVAGPRSFEGAGIGLSLVRELARLLGGDVSLQSRVGEGSTFTVVVPWDEAHSDLRDEGVRHEPVAPATVATFVEEARGWLSPEMPSRVDIDSSGRETVLVVDDNAGMREYLRRLLEPQYDVITARDGIDALAAAAARVPTLVVTDVMMPGLDGFALLERLKKDPLTEDIPVIIVSAHAGEAAIVDGLRSGADDYLVKPFSARELLARVRAHIDLASSRRKAREAEVRYRAFIANSSEAIWRAELEEPMPIGALSAEEQIAWFFEHAYMAECNDAMARQYGYRTAAELEGTRLPDLLPPSDPRNVEYLRAFIESGYKLTDAESIERDRSGEVRYIINNLVGVEEHGYLVRAWGTQSDVTAVRIASQRVAFLARAGEVLASTLDPESIGAELGRLLSESLAECSIVRRSDEVMVHPGAEVIDPALLQGLRDETQAIAADAVLEVDAASGWLASRPSIAALAKKACAKTIFVMPIEARGRTYGSVTILSRRSLSVDDIQLATEVVRRASAAIDNATLYTAAHAANIAKDEFLATLSHELRTPMTATLGWAAMLKMGGLTDDTFRVAVDALEQSTRTQAKLIDDILDVSRISSGKLRVNLAPVQLRTVIAHAIDTMWPAAEAKKIAVDIDIIGCERPLLGDADRLQQVIWNLLSNAVKFTPRGGVVTLRAREAAGQVTVSVSDTGEGIAPDFLPNVFERFRQADSSSSRKHAGLGLGLSIVKSIVEMHGGSVTAASEGLGRGATFTLTLPTTTEEQSDAPAQSRPVALDGLSVLVVEDEPATRLMLGTALSHFSATVALAGSVDEALARLSEASPDVIVSDIAMPDRDGYELIRELRKNGPHPPAIALTAHGTTADRDRAIAEGFHGYLAKPVDPADLVREVLRLAGR